MYEVTVYCPDCDGAGFHTPTSDLSCNIEHECSVCDGTGEKTFKEVTELYENTQGLEEDYPEGKIERVA
tara:strand:- start:385 stop:591 length:207 start_codon:yes stop_codon:yes gene_type:complete